MNINDCAVDSRICFQVSYIGMCNCVKDHIIFCQV
jgi:hypothetical protein